MPLRRWARWAAFAALLIAMPAQAMPVREFLARWDRLSSLKEMARLDPDLPTLTGELGAIVKSYRAEVETAAAAGKPIACLPPAGQAQLSSDALVAFLKALPPAGQEQELKGAVYTYLTKTYPC